MNIPNVEFLEKMFVFLGLTIISVSGYHIFNSYNELKATNKDLTQVYATSSFELKKILKDEKNHIIELTNYNNEMKKIEVKAREATSSQDFFTVKKELKAINDKIDSSSLQYNSLMEMRAQEKDSINSLLEFKKMAKTDFLSVYHYEIKTAFGFILFGMFLFFIGLYAWAAKDRFERTMLIRQNLDKPTYSECCQSCGRTFNAAVVFGKETDGQKNFNFCNTCFIDGKFLEPELTFALLIARVKEELKRNKVSTFKIRQVIKRISGLDRWKNNY